MKDTPPRKRIRHWILLFFLLSGSTGLIYEIAWMKMLILVVGNTVYSTTTVLASFMGGLALGSFLAGKFLDKFKNPLRTYGLLEGMIAVNAVLVPLLIAGTHPLFRYLYQSSDTSPHEIGLLRVVVCGVILLVPTSLMGATLPILCKFFALRETELGWTVGKLYGINTLGAVLGSSAAGFLLIPTLGIGWTVRLAALLNLGIAAAVWTLSRASAGTDLKQKDSEVKEKKRKKQKKRKQEEVEPHTWGRRVVVSVMVTIGLTGVASMIYQIAWTRVLSLFIGSSVYAFSLIVTAFISGLALGSLVLGKFIDRRKNLVLGLALLEGAIGLSALLMVPILGRLPAHIAEMLVESTLSFHRLQVMEFGIMFLLMLLPTFLMGAAFPIAARICAADVSRFGKDVGTVYAINTLGAIVGTLLGGFLLIPWLGTQEAIFTAVLINLLAMGVVLLGGLGLSLKRAALTLATAAIAVVAWHQFPSWDSLLLTSGPYIYAERYQRVSETKKIELEEAMKEGRELLFFEEGLHAVVSVERTHLGDLALQINGKADASANGDARTQLMLGHVPLLLHPGPKTVLVIGLGSGMTLGAVERYPVEAIEVVELEPAVVRANVLFRPFNGDALNDHRVNLIVADGRNHLALTERQYDVIISEPSNPWVAGMSNLFTREFFELSKKRLRDGGIMCQWLHAYSMIPRDFKTIVATFQSVFPHMSLWEVKLGGDYLLIGSSEKLAIGYETVRSRLSEERMGADLKKMNLSDLPSLLARVLMEEEAAAEYAAGAPLHTDDNARLEYSAPRGFFKDEKKTLVTEIHRHRSSPADVLRSFDWDEPPSEDVEKHRRLLDSRKDVLAGYVHVLEHHGPEAVESLMRALVLNPKDAEAVHLLHKIYVEMGERFEKAGDHEKALETYTKSVNVISRFASGDPELLRHQFELNVAYGRTQLRLGMMSLSSNDLEKAARAIEISLQDGVETAEAHVNLGAVYGKIGKLDEALREYERALEMKPGYAVAHVNYANVCLRLGRYDEAIDSYHEAQRLRPNYEMTHYNLGAAYFQRGEWARAAGEWRRALELKPNFPEARRSLDAALEKIKLERGPN